MNLRRFARIEGNVCSYIHGGGRIGVIVEAETTAVNDDVKEALPKDKTPVPEPVPENAEGSDEEDTGFPDFITNLK